MTQAGPSEVAQFYQAIQDKNLKTFSALLSKKSVQSELNAEPLKAIGKAAEVGNYEMFNALRKVSVVDTALKENPDEVVLGAVQGGSVQCVNVLLALEKTKEFVKEYFRYLLPLAFKGGHTDVAELLFAQKEGIELISDDIFELLCDACEVGNFRIFKALMEFNGEELLMELDGSDEVIDLIDTDLLRRAINGGSLDIVKWLIKLKKVRAEFVKGPIDILEDVELGGNEEVFAYLLEIQAVKDYFYLKPSAEKQELLDKIIKAFPGTQTQTLSNQILENLARLGHAQESFKKVFKEGSLKEFDELLSSFESAALGRYLGRGALLESAFKHSPETEKAKIVARLLKVEGMLEHVKKHLNNTLCLAAQSGGSELVDVLLRQKEIDAAIKANPHDTLMWAIYSRSDVLLKSLLTIKEVDATLKRTDPSRIIVAMFKSDNPEMVNLLRGVKKIETELMRDVRQTMRSLGLSKNREIINAFLADGKIQAMIERNPFGALHGAVRSGNINLFNALLLNADVYFYLNGFPEKVLEIVAADGNVEFFNKVMKHEEVRAQLIEQPFDILKLAVKENKVDLVNAMFELEALSSTLEANPKMTLGLVMHAKRNEGLARLLENEAIQTAFLVQGDPGDIDWLKRINEENPELFEEVVQQIEAKFEPLDKARKELSEAFLRGDVEKVGQLVITCEREGLLKYLVPGRDSNTLLRQAINQTPKQNRVQMVRRLLQSSAIKESLKKAPMDTLLDALKSGSVELVNVLRGVKEVESVLRTESSRVLGTAIRCGSVELVNLLLSIKEVKSTLAKYPARFLVNAAQTGSVELIAVLREVKEVDAELKANPSKVLLNAALSGSVGLVNELLAVKEVEAAFKNNPTQVLAEAINSGSIELVNMLFHSEEIGTALKAKPKQALELVQKIMNKEMLICLLEKKEFKHAFYMEATKQDRVFLQRLNKYKFEPLKKLATEIESNLTRLEKWQDAFIKAFSKGDIEEVESILALGVRSDLSNYLARDDNAILKDAIKLAKDPSRIAIIRRLLQEEGIKAQLKKKPVDILVRAAQSGSLELINVLCKFKSVDAAIQQNPQLMLESAVQSGSVELVNNLREIKAIDAALRAHPIDVLMRAVQSGNIAMFKSILAAKEVHAALKADPFTILNLAEFTSDPQMIALMLELNVVKQALSTQATPHVKKSLTEMAEKFPKTRVEEIVREIEANHVFIDEMVKQLGIAINQGSLKEMDALLQKLKERNLDAALAQNGNALFLHAINNAPKDYCVQVVKKLLENLAIRQAEGLESSPFHRAGQHLARQNGNKALASVIQESVAELEIASAKEGAMRGLTPKQAILFRVLELRYGHKVDKKRAAAAWKEMQAAIKTFCKASPIRYKAPGKNTRNLPLQPKRALSDAELALYYQDEWHTAFRYFLNPNPWMSDNARYVAGSPREGTGYASVSENDRILFAMLWEAVNDDTLEVPFMEGATPNEIAEVRANHRETFLKEFSGLNRAHNWDKYKTRDDGGGDQPTCDRGVTQRMASFLQRRLALPILTKQDIEGRFVNAFIEPVIDKMSLTEVIRLIKWVEFYAYIEDEPVESAEEKRKSHLDFFTIPEKERDAFKKQCQEIYKASSGSDNALKEPQTVRVSGIMSAKLDNYDAFVDLLSEDPEQTIKYFLSGVSERLELRKKALEKQVAPSPKRGLGK